MKSNAITDFGKTIKKRLIDMDKSHNWLIEQVSKNTGLFFDGSYLRKIMTGELKTPKIVQAIKEILNISETPHT